MFDEELERQAADDFMESECTRFMSTERLIEIAIEGITYCEDANCTSKQIAGESCCMCIRSMFPSHDFYLLYLQLRKIYMKNHTLTKIKEIQIEPHTKSN